MPTPGFDPIGILIFIGIIILLFLLFREILTWYWKINKIVSLLEDIKWNTEREEDVATDVQGEKAETESVTQSTAPSDPPAEN